MFIVNGVSGALLHCINFRVATDPACGSGNFLTETYLELRRLENKALKLAYKGDSIIADFENFEPIKVKLDQFFGIEINDFAVAVANTALFIAEFQMFEETENIFHQKIDYLPLHSFNGIHEGNALLIDWNSIISADKCNYILGNPPYLGARKMLDDKKAEIFAVFGSNWKGVGNLDYVSGWFKKTADYIRNTKIECAFIATNSIVQGQSIGFLWEPLLKNGIIINFAHLSFQWSSESLETAEVFCVVIGFSYFSRKNKYIYNEKTKRKVKYISPYLNDYLSVIVKSRRKAICSSPKIGIGNKPIDGKNYLFEKKEMEEFIKKEPKSKKYFHPWYGTKELLNNKPRYCLWLGECSPHDLNEMPEVKKRVKAVKEYRLSSNSKPTQKLANKPTRFHVENFPKERYLVIPEYTSIDKEYMPMKFLTPDCLASNLVKIVENVDMYEFGVLISSAHFFWTKKIGGRLGEQYRYSINVIYNNFPWPNPTKKQKEKIKKTAQNILKVRKKFSESTLNELYDPITMPNELNLAHKLNDEAVMESYGWNLKDMDEETCITELIKLYYKRLNEIDKNK